jgi:hypothetical protein
VVSSYTWDSLPVDPRSATLSEAKREMLVRNRIAMALEQLIRLREGQFNFSLTEDVPKAVGGRRISAETLREGINPQELLLDLARGIDEDRRDLLGCARSLLRPAARGGGAARGPGVS